jgi:hypothetical protein
VNDLPLAPRPKQYHSVKCIQPFYTALENGTKTFEVRWNDRDYRAGDTLIVNEVPECEPRMLDPTKRPMQFTVTYVLQGEEWGIKKGYVILGLQRLNI